MTSLEFSKTGLEEVSSFPPIYFTGQQMDRGDFIRVLWSNYLSFPKIWFTEKEKSFLTQNNYILELFYYLV